METASLSTLSPNTNMYNTSSTCHAPQYYSFFFNSLYHDALNCIPWYFIVSYIIPCTLLYELTFIAWKIARVATGSTADIKDPEFGK